ncbi:voltage-dependent calcium channel beta subunit-associated regulatory protein-like [Branchiostoma lanceolatum]|uniref:voltage-dependent calcium channel beta subunit-associated regulatory protein-like n=1 Tax=Branchiostoma lanceolatum TaxID=7740 RepID=UPI003454D368
MDLGTESSKYPGDVTQGTSEEAPSNLPTVLIACGAVGGAVLVALTIAVCRYCLGRRKGIKSEVRGDYGEGENFDINVHTLSDIPEDAVPTLVLSGGQLGVPDQSTQRRVSFQGVDLLDDDDSPLRRDSNKRRRYTEGDFHHLKKARLNKTLGLPAILKSASVDSPRPARETYPLLTITHADEMADEAESPKETDTESPGPDSRRSDRRKSSEVSVPVEVHRGSEPSKQEGSGEQSAVRQFFRKLQKHASLDAVLPSQQKIQQWKTSRPWKSFDCQVLSSHPRPLLRQRAVSDPVERDPGKPDFTLDRKNKNSSSRFQSTGNFQALAGAEDLTPVQSQQAENKTASLSAPDNKDLSRHIWHLRTTLELDTDVSSQHGAESPNGDNLSSPEQEGSEGKVVGCVSPAAAASAPQGPAARPRSPRRPLSRQASEERETEGGGGGGEDPPSPNTRLLMMQSDSGYVSIEKQPKLVHQKEGIRFTFDEEDLESMAAVREVPTTFATATSPRVTVQDFSQDQEKQQEQEQSEPSQEKQQEQGQSELSPVPLSPKSAAERRKSFTSEGKTEPVPMDLEASAEGNSGHRPASPSKQLVVKGKFRLASAKERYEYPRRDYSIDEKTDAIFNEFLRQDVMFEDTLSVRSRRRHHRKRHSESLSEQANHHSAHAHNRSPERHRLPISGSNTLPHDKSKNKGIMRRLVPDNHDRSMHKVVTERTDDRVSVESGSILPRRATSPNTTTTSSEKTDTGRNTL